MARTYKITGKDSTDDTEYANLDDARIALREPFLGKRGEWVEDYDARGNFKVKFVGKQQTRSWLIKVYGKDDE